MVGGEGLAKIKHNNSLHPQGILSDNGFIEAVVFLQFSACLRGNLRIEVGQNVGRFAGGKMNDCETNDSNTHEGDEHLKRFLCQISKHSSKFTIKREGVSRPGAAGEAMGVKNMGVKSS